MKFDFKNIMLFILLITSVVFGYSWYSNKSYSHDSKIKKYITEIRKLEKEKLAYRVELDSLDSELNIFKERSIELDKQLSKLLSKLANLENIASSSKKKYDDLQKDLLETRRQIILFENNPPNRTGDFLIESIKNKTK